MNSILRMTLALSIATAITGCSSLNTKQTSELRQSIEAPVVMADATKTSFCITQPHAVSEPSPIYTAPAPFAAKLYFLSDKTDFTVDSEAEAAKIYQEILSRDPSEVSLSGHTDTKASDEYNEALSRRRSERVKQDLINVGLAADIISTSSEGEYRLLVATPDETVEALNRRVEINLR